MAVDYQFKAPNYFEPDKGYVSLGLGRMKIKIVKPWPQTLSPQTQKLKNQGALGWH